MTKQTTEQQDDGFDPLRRACYRYGWGQPEFSADFMRNITVKTRDDKYLYNYNNLNRIPRDHPILKRCRGIVIREDGLIVNYPFNRFFNYFEPECATIDWNSATVQEKVDGSLVCVWWDDSEMDWQITTRGSFYPNDTNSVNFASIFRRLFAESDLNKLMITHCYMFELVSKENRIVKWYDDERVYLLSARSLRTLREVVPWSLDVLCERYLKSCMRPARFRASNLTECISLFEKFADDDEGLVVTDKDFNRLKIKQETYINLTKIKLLKDQDLFDYIRGITELDSELIHRTPEIVDRLRVIETKWQEIYSRIESIYRRIRAESKTRKEFAANALKHPFSDLLFKLYDNRSIDQSTLNWKKVKEW